MEESEAETPSGGLSHFTLLVAGTIAGALTLVWTAFLVWLVLKALSLM